MIINGPALLYVTPPIKGMVTTKVTGPGGTSYGLGEAGYDIRIKQSVSFRKLLWLFPQVRVDGGKWKFGRFTLASAIEEFDLHTDTVGIVHDKSTWARKGLSVFNTVIEPGWTGFLTLELVFHGSKQVDIPAGSGIAQVVFHQTRNHARYSGKYQNQPDLPVEAINSL